MCAFLKKESGTILVPLKNVSWNNEISDILCSNNEPDCGYSYPLLMHYYYLNPIFDQWFQENGGEYGLFWCDTSSSWFLEIFDIHLSVLFKLSFNFP